MVLKAVMRSLALGSHREVLSKGGTESALCFRKTSLGTSLLVQQLKLHTPNAGNPGSVSGQRTRSLMPQLRPSAAK